MRSGTKTRQVLAAGALLAGVAIAIYVYRTGEIEFDPQALRLRIEALGWLAPLAYIALAALRPFVALPSWMVMTVGGLLFGILGGIVFSVIGFTLGSLVSFGIARGLGRDAVRARMRGRIERFDAYLTRRGGRWIAFYTALPVTPLTPVHSAAGLSGISVAVFAASVAFGLVPRTAGFSVFGDSFTQGDLGQTILIGGILVVVGLIGVQIVRRSWRDGGAS